jgi:hypothetical protein
MPQTHHSQYAHYVNLAPSRVWVPAPAGNVLSRNTGLQSNANVCCAARGNATLMSTGVCATRTSVDSASRILFGRSTRRLLKEDLKAAAPKRILS